MKEEKDVWDDLVVRIAGDDRSAFAALYERFQSPVYGLALAILKNRCDAEDVMQNAFVQVWDRAGSYRPGTDAGAWILKITRNLSMDRLRSRKDMADIMDLEDTLAGGDEISPEMDRLLLAHLLEALDCGERQMVLLHAWGYTHGEIARIVGRPAATVRWKYGRAIKKLQDLLEKEDFDGQKAQFPAGS